MSMLDYNRQASKRKLMRGEPVPWIENAKRARYIRQCVLSFPPWVDRKALHKLWLDCRRQEVLTGVPHTLDHIVPLNHPYVCGLTVPWNLRAVPALHNFSKGNDWHPDQLAFDIPHFLLHPQRELFDDHPV